MNRVSNVKINLKIVMTLGIVILFFLPSSIIIAETNNISIENSEIISFNYVNDNELIISLTPQDVIQDKLISENGQFTTFYIPNTGFTGNLGKPQLPLITKMIAVPTKDVTIKILNSQIGESKFVGKIYPAQSPQYDNGKYEKTEFIIDESFYQQDIEYPGILADIIYDGKIRDINFIKIEFYPIQYNPKQETATIYNEITIEISWDSIDSLSVESDFNHSSFIGIYENTFSNWQGFIENTQLIEKTQGYGIRSQDSGCDYIIITHPDFYSEISELARWKHAKGYKTHLVDTTVTGTTSSAIKQYIQDAYDTWDPRPSYLLLVGDAEFVPTSSSSTGTDLYYATVDGSDYFPDIFYGRIPADSPQEVELIVDKIITYEQTPPSLESFYENFVVAAYFQDDEPNGYESRRFVRTSEEIRDYMLSINYQGERIYCTEPYINPTHYNNGYYGNGEPLPSELLRPTFAWDGDADDIINAIESGIFILNHRDHGFEYGWGDPYFDTSHVSGLTNGELLPVVFSINCLTGSYDNTECFAEEFLRKDGGGAVAVFAATRVSYSGYNDFLCRGFYDAQWPDFDIEVGTDIAMYTLGELLNYGKVYMTQTWGDPWGYEEYTFELFHVFGDPTMEIWTAFPEDLVVDHPDMVKGGSSTIEIYVEDSDGNPIERALICLNQENGLYAKNLTDKYGYAELEIEVEEPDDITLIVTAHNCLYYSADLKVDAPEPPIVDGPAFGRINKEYEYTAVTTDPGGDQILYMFDWGDGTQTDWIGPVNSGESVSASHSWSEIGDYNVKARAKNVEDSRGKWSDPPYTVHMDVPDLKIGTVRGGLFYITATFKNDGVAEADDINWKISLEGGTIILGRTSTGTITNISAGGEETVRSNLIFGFGQMRVKVTSSGPECYADCDRGGKIFFIYIHVNPGGG